MRFSTGLVTTLVATAHALPKRATGVIQAREEIPEPSPIPSDVPNASVDDDNEGKSPQQIVDDAPEYVDENETVPNIIKTCPANAKTTENWLNYEVGEWFEVLANGEEPYTQDIQKTILTWGYTEDVYKFHCEPMQHCDASFDMKDCVENWGTAGIYFVLQSIINFNNYLTSLANAVDQTHGIVDGKAAKIVEEFSSAPDDLTISSVPGVLTAGIIGMIGALLTGPLAIGAAIGGSLATTAVAIIGLINEGHSIELEPKFNDFADVTAYLADASSTLQTALEDYARWVLTETPNNDRENGIYYIEDQRALPRQLSTGAFAEPIEVDRLPDNLYASLFSGAITELWNKDQVIVVKIPSDESLLDAPACDDAGPFVGRRYCDDDGNSYVLLKYPELGSWLDRPWDDSTREAFMDINGIDKLEDYGLSIGAVAIGTETAYIRNNKEAGYGWNAETTMEFLMEDPENMIHFVTFNFPFCDLSLHEPLLGRVEDDACDAECQILYSITQRCTLYFPWDHTEQVNWKDSCSWIPGYCDENCFPGSENPDDCGEGGVW